MIAFIQAGGAGTRLKEISGDIPKPMVRICDKPILEYQIINLVKNGFEKAIIVVPKNSTAIQDYFGDGESFGIKIEYIVEEIPLGTGGALFYLAKMVKEDFALCFGDLMIDIDWKRMINFHKEKEALITTFAHPNSHPYDSDVLVAGPTGKVLTILSKKEPRDFYYENLTNAGLYIVSKDILETFSDLEEPFKEDFEKDILAPSLDTGFVFAYKSSEYVKDCGTPDRYYSVTEDCKNGIISKRNLQNKQKCIFLDRDGTINVFGDFVRKAEDLILQKDAAEAIKKINQSSYLSIVITNQPVVARGEVSMAELHNIHNRMEDLLGEQGAYVNDLYFCPHHPDKGFEGEIKELKIECDCRKPKIGLFKRAEKDYNIDLSASWMVGDTHQDVQAGINAGCKTILLTCGDPFPAKKYKEAKPDYICKSLDEAINIILSRENKI